MGSRLNPDRDELFDRCIEVCRSYRLDRVVAANIRACLSELTVPRAELNLFSMVLARHVRRPDDRFMGQAALSLWQHLLDLDRHAESTPAGRC